MDGALMDGTSCRAEAVVQLERALEQAATVRPAVGGFPYFAESLRRSGVHRNRWYVPAALALYETDAGPVVARGQAPAPVEGSAVAAAFDADAVVAALRVDQAGESTFPEFLATIWRAGVFEFDVDLEARTCTYFGVDRREHYVESYLVVEL
jgi:uncharacterized protein YbcV (DUF1398 family)